MNVLVGDKKMRRWRADRSKHLFKVFSAILASIALALILLIWLGWGRPTKRSRSRQDHRAYDPLGVLAYPERTVPIACAAATGSHHRARTMREGDMADDLEHARKRLEDEYGQVRRRFDEIHERFDRVASAGPEDDLRHLLKDLEKKVKKIRTGGWFARRQRPPPRSRSTRPPKTPRLNRRSPVRAESS